MATTSTPEQNDPTVDNRGEYTLPPVVAEMRSEDDELGIELPEFDTDGFVVERPKHDVETPDLDLETMTGEGS